MAWTRLPFLLHSLVETGAAFTFTFRPKIQLPGASPETILVLRSYGALLWATVFLGGYFGVRNKYDGSSVAFGLSMAFYHVFPIYRAYVRLLSRPGKLGEQRVLGGPKVHLLVHLVCLGSLVAAVLGT